MSTSGVAAYNPATALPAIVDANELTFTSTTLSGATTAGASTLTLASTTGLAVDQYIQVGPQGTGAEVLQITAISSPTITVFPSTGKNHSNGDPVVVKVLRQVISIGSPTTTGNEMAVSANGSALIQTGTTRNILTSASSTGATNIKNTAGTLVSFYCTGADLNVYLQLYDSATTTVSQSVCIFGDGQSDTGLAAGQIITLNCPLVNGLTYTLTGSLPSTANIVIITA